MDNGASSYRRFLDGEESAFDEIMKELFYGLVFFIDRYVQDTQAAEDIAIDAFADLIVHRHKYNFKVTLKTYLYMVGRSRALDYLKRRKETEVLSLAENIEDAKSLEEMVLADERKRAINLALQKLPEDMGLAVHLIYLEGMTYKDAARIMKKSPKQVDNLLYRGKKELRILLGEDGEGFQ